MSEETLPKGVMISLFIIVLAAVGVLSALLLARGGVRGPNSGNPWFFISAAGSVLLSTYTLELLPEASWIPWAGAGIAIGGMFPSRLREKKLWENGSTRPPGTQEWIIEIVLIFTAIIVALSLRPELPVLARAGHRIQQLSLVLLSAVPLLMGRWALTRLDPRPVLEGDRESDL